MAVHAISGTLTAATASLNTLTSWQKYVIVTLNNPTAAAVTVGVTVDGSTPVAGAADTPTVTIIAGSATAPATTTIALNNLLPAAELQTTTPLATDPSAVDAFTTAQSKVNLITAATRVTYSVELSPNPGSAIVLG